MPAALTSALFEPAWWLTGLLVAAGVVAFFAVRGRPAAWLALPLTFLLLAAGHVALGRAVVTDREAADLAVRGMVAAAAPFDPAAFDAALTPDAELLGPAGDRWMRFSEVRDRVREYAGRGRTIEHVVKSLEVDPVTGASDGSAATLALLRVTSRGGAGPGGSGLPTSTAWELDLRREPAGPWRVRSFRWLQLNLQPPPDASAWR